MKSIFHLHYSADLQAQAHKKISVPDVPECLTGRKLAMMLDQ